MIKMIERHRYLFDFFLVLVLLVVCYGLANDVKNFVANRHIERGQDYFGTTQWTKQVAVGGELSISRVVFGEPDGCIAHVDRSFVSIHDPGASIGLPVSIRPSHNKPYPVTAVVTVPLTVSPDQYLYGAQTVTRSNNKGLPECPNEPTS